MILILQVKIYERNSHTCRYAVWNVYDYTDTNKVKYPLLKNTDLG